MHCEIVPSKACRREKLPKTINYELFKKCMIQYLKNEEQWELL
jgi:hypothetical protein